MTANLTDNPAVTISLSLDRGLLERLNAAARLSPEVASRSALVRDLLELALDVVLEPAETLPAVIAGLRDAYAPETDGAA